VLPAESPVLVGSDVQISLSEQFTFSRQARRKRTGIRAVSVLVHSAAQLLSAVAVLTFGDEYESRAKYTCKVIVFAT
jgi:hypothetical protein